MTQFSKRYGYIPLERAFQREFVDNDLRTMLWNVLNIFIWQQYESGNQRYSKVTRDIDDLVTRLWLHFFNKDIDELPQFSNSRYEEGAYGGLKSFFMSCMWYQVYDFIEAVAADESGLVSEGARRAINGVLEKQNSAYRLVENQIVEITDKNEIQSIEAALSLSDVPIKTHLNAALRMLSDKEAPDYRNSVKESISAVEAACRLVSADESATLGAALKRINALHPAMSKAFAQLYGYTSDASGIRHALMDQSTVSYADAKFMLVICSAFVSYLKVAASA